MDDLLADASRLLGLPLADPRPLGGSARSQVLRATVRGAGPELSVVIKRFGPGRAAEAARERTGLAHLTATPDLLAADEAGTTLVMTDLGAHATLADLLLGDDPAAAWDGAVGWAAALGEMLGRSRGQVSAAHRQAEPHDARAVLGGGVEHLITASGTTAGGLAGEVERVGDALGRTDRAVLSPGDTCPDNALLTPDGWRFCDLEGTSVQDPALDAAYAVLPFASCWCVFDPPTGLADAMLDALTGSLAEHVDLGETWARDVDLACAGFVLASTGWLWDGALAGRSVGPAGRPSPTHRALLAARWTWAADHLAGATPRLADVCASAARWAEREWGATPLASYPAFA